jgi:hypothetical protein
MLLDAFKPLRLLSGPHADTGTTGQGCFMNVIAYLNGEAQITDQSTCVCVVVRPIAIWINDYLMDSERDILLPYIGRAMGSATRDQKELFRRATRAAGMAEEMRDIADADVTAAAYAADAAKAAAEAANAAKTAEAAKASDYAAVASTHAAKASTYAAKASDYAADASTCAAETAYATARKRIIDACLRFLDDCLPELETVGPKPVERAKRPALAH